MQASSALHQVLYLSHLAPPHEYDAFTAICRTSRLRNARLGVTGVLLFDGHRFCQVLQGPEAGVQSLMDEIALDPRHERLSVLFEAPLTAAALSRSWTAGYCEAEDLDTFEGPDAPAGEAALLAFREILARADLEP